jgi:hypothetical protein
MSQDLSYMNLFIFSSRPIPTFFPPKKRTINYVFTQKKHSFREQL